MVLPWHMPLQTCCMAPHITPDDDDDTALDVLLDVLDEVLDDVVDDVVEPLDCDVLDDDEVDWVELLLPVDDVPPVPPEPPSPMDDP